MTSGAGPRQGTSGQGTPRQGTPRASLVDEDPREILLRALANLQTRATQDGVELAEARHALARLGDPARQASSEVARVTLEVASSLIHDLAGSTSGPMRQLIMTDEVGASALDQDMDAYTREVIAGGRVQLAIYDSSLLDRPDAVARAQAFRTVGEQQRVVDGATTEFLTFGTEAVVCVEVWGDPASDYVLVRDPMLVSLFVAYFDEVWARALPFPASRSVDDDEDEQLLDLLARGFKDEAIARYLGWSLRTVRRRVARLMDELGARTRFQLGAQAVLSGRMSQAPHPQALPGARLGRPPRSR
ncbi:helix-turn-helix domain-containing protein [Dermatophilaceae bacterium Soc4.6]